MRKTILLLVAIPLLLTGCKGETPVEPKDYIEVNSQVPSYILGKAGGYQVSYKYKDEYFLTDAKVVNKDIAMLSFGSAAANDSRSHITSFYNQMSFEDIYTSPDYEEPKENSINYLMAHKEIEEGTELVAISVMGFDYKKEWVSNLKMEKEGNHVGFEMSAITIFDKLVSYIDDLEYTTLKLWITGFSRAGATSNVLSYLILDYYEDITIDQSNMFVYTFEAPKGLLQENAVAYPNVFNFINVADVVHYTAPAEYGFARCGTDINIYVDNVGNVVKSFDYDIGEKQLGKFTKSAGVYETEAEYCQFIIDTLIKHLPTREDFVDSIQNPLAVLMGCFFSLPYEGQNELMAAFGTDPLGKLSEILEEEDGLYKFLYPFLDKYQVDYDQDDLRNSCHIVLEFVLSMVTDIFSLMGNIGRTINMHMPEIEYALMLNYCK